MKQACVKRNDVKPVRFETDPKSIECFLEAHCKKYDLKIQQNLKYFFLILLQHFSLLLTLSLSFNVHY